MTKGVASECQSSPHTPTAEVHGGTDCPASLSSSFFKKGPLTALGPSVLRSWATRRAAPPSGLEGPSRGTQGAQLPRLSRAVPEPVPSVRPFLRAVPGSTLAPSSSVLVSQGSSACGCQACSSSARRRCFRGGNTLRSAADCPCSCCFFGSETRSVSVAAGLGWGLRRENGLSGACGLCQLAEPLLGTQGGEAPGPVL